MSTLDASAGHAPRNYHAENIAGKTAVISGGTTGIGYATARLLVERGAKVLIFGRNESDLDKALNELKPLGEAHGVSADQSKVEDIKRVFAEVDSKLGKLDILVNNAAVFAGSVTKASAEEIAYCVNVNLIGYMLCTKEAIERMEKNEPADEVGIKGHVISVGSLSAEVREKESEVYVATKAGIQAFHESLRKTVNPRGIKVSLIEPGRVWSDLAARSMTPEDAAKKQREGSLLQAEEIAEAVHYTLTQPSRCDVISIQIRPHAQLI